MTLEEFIEKAQKVHGLNTYDYSETVYKNNITPLEIKDREYGVFTVIPTNHIYRRQGHPKRTSNHISNISLSWLLSIDPEQNFITPYHEPTLVINERKRKVDGYDSTTNTVYQFHGSYWHGYNGKAITDQKRYQNTINKDQEIIDSGYKLVVMWQHDWKPTEEDWKRIPVKKSNTELFIEKARKVHGDLYDYSKVIYINAITKVWIGDPKYGYFLQTPMDHLRGHGNSNRSLETVKTKLRITFDEFIKRSREKHGDMFDYSLSEYKNVDTPILIKHPLYGIFKQRPKHHMNGLVPIALKGKIER